MDRQQELFTEFEVKNGPKKFFGKGLLPEKTFSVILTREKLTLAILGLIGVLAAVFVFGFECGRKSVFEKRLSMPKQIKQEATKPPIEIKQKPLLPALKPYTIQVATFKSKEFAQQEIEKLRKKGYSTTLIGINGLYEIWVGDYAGPKEAQQTLNILKKTYMDCLIRKR